MPLYKPLCDVSGQAEEPISLCRINGLTDHTGLSRASYYPVCDLVAQFLCLCVQRIRNVTEICKLVHQLQGLLPAFDCQDAFQAHNAACPAPSIDFIDVTTVVRLPTSEGCAGGQARPSTHYALTGRQLISWQFDPLVFKQTLHCADLLPDRLKKATLRATLINTEARLTKNVIYL